MSRFFITNTPIGSEIDLTGIQYHHLANVYRAKPGMLIELFDQAGIEYQAQVIGYGQQSIRLQILSSKPQQVNSSMISICICQALLKSKAWDLLLTKLMELGISRLQPMTTANIADARLSCGRPERWHKILVSSAKQCGRSLLLDISPILTFEQVLCNLPANACKLIAHQDSNAMTLKQAVEKLDLSNIVILIGPEGGFTVNEMQQAQAFGVIPITLGRYILRAETAAIAISSSLQLFFNQGI